ncbi:MAG TPA: 2-amino-4-hydroxy-6-hydroxymethyldihydropteridine diphosphokinase [Acidobacteriota bacterium]|nr:2-amino-4-hydroxy-6-hydroxymethyldihydropteridine diphosphokinase [Acidobacteriota bacterium]
MNTALPRHIAYLGIGSNRGDRRANLQAACRLLRAADGVEELVGSPVYETCAIGLAGPAEFLNAVVRVTTQLAPTALLRTVRAIERALGRGIDRAGPRTIDLDILLYDDLVLATESLTVPHPRLHERAFVLVPFADLAPETPHPQLGSTVRELLERLPDTSAVIRRSADLA